MKSVLEVLAYVSTIISVIFGILSYCNEKKAKRHLEEIQKIHNEIKISGSYNKVKGNNINNTGNNSGNIAGGDINYDN